MILTLSSNVDSNRLDIQNYGVQLCLYIHHQLGEPDFLKLIGAFLNVQQQQNLIKGFEQ